ncbi:hypothetical protein A2U01_0046099 [Trifolium medium]|uniref:Uncharacterized protein n=1 Tax=Trifolium medium TaxID=97028 RepID=A0A392QM32_9FABA|nr:hypothetical protein [Trifolium medium]
MLASETLKPCFKKVRKRDAYKEARACAAPLCLRHTPDIVLSSWLARYCAARKRSGAARPCQYQARPKLHANAPRAMCFALRTRDRVENLFLNFDFKTIATITTNKMERIEDNQ